MSRTFMVAGTPRKRHDDRDTEAFGQPHGLAKHLVVAPGRFRIGVQGIPVTRQCADREPRIIQHPAEASGTAGIAKQTIDINMIATGPCAGSKLECLDLLERSDLGKHVLEREVSEYWSE
jgi:hypothetical protein